MRCLLADFTRIAMQSVAFWFDGESTSLTSCLGSPFRLLQNTSIVTGAVVSQLC